MASKAEKSAATRSHIIAVARRIFACKGFSGASLSEIVSHAKVTTGAVYHHFSDKKGLFRAVAESVEQEILNAVIERIGKSKETQSGIEGNEFTAFEKGVEFTLEVCAQPGIQRIVFHDAPAVIGQREWREVEMKYAFGLMQNMLASLSANGIIKNKNTEMLAQIILGAIIEAAHAVALSGNQKEALSEAKSIVLTMLGSLKRDC
ncbi:MAG: TetR/AcrR family transcriptional regulator [Alphaproteobacteria bacterium]|nr:TetR/AcrR family transcriptional regulator [Alphaproteobacteria bacterium]